MIIVVILLHTLLSCCINQVLSGYDKIQSIDEFISRYTAFCHTVLHHEDKTDTRLRIFDMKEFIKGNPRFPPDDIEFQDRNRLVQIGITIEHNLKIHNKPGGFKSITIDFGCLDVLKNNSDYLRNRFPQLQPYFDCHQTISRALSALAILAQNVDLTSLENLHAHASAYECIYKATDQFLTIPNLSAAANFDLALLNLLMLTMTGDFYSHAILHDTSTKLRGNWTKIEVAYQKEENYLLENWAKEQLADDIKAKVEQSTAAANSDPLFPWPDISIQKLLENKYYWNAFRVHVYPREKVHNVERFLCTNADSYPKTACVKGGDKIAVVHWQPLAEEKLKNKDKVLNRRELPTELKTVFEVNQDKPAPSSTFTAARAGLDMAFTLEPVAETTLDNLFPKKTVIENGKDILEKSAKEARGAARVFKGALKFAVNVGKFLGPLSAGITGLLGVILDEGMPNVMEEMRAGFKDMSAEFRKIDTKLDAVKNEIMNAVKSENWMSAFHVSYFERVKLPLSKLRREFEGYDGAIRGPSEEYKRKELYAFCDRLSYSDGVVSPVSLLNDMHTYFAATTGGKTFPDAIKNWDDAKSHRPTLQLLLAGFLMDVTDLEAMVQRCMPILLNGTTTKQQRRQVIAGYSAKVALAQRQAYEIKRVIFELNHAQLYRWRDSIQGTFDKWSPKPEFDLKSMAVSLAQELQKEYGWNNFSVLIFKNKVDGSGHASEAFILHPDYTKIFTRTEYTYVVNWANRDEPLATVQHLANEFTNTKYRYCADVLNARMIMDRASEIGVPKGAKSVYIRKDIAEDGYYGPDDKKAVDALSRTTVEFKEPRGCCGTAGEFDGSYGQALCWVNKNNERDYCTKTKEEIVCSGLRGRTSSWCKKMDVCDTYDKAQYWTKHIYAIAMNTGGGY